MPRRRRRRWWSPAWQWRHRSGRRRRRQFATGWKANRTRRWRVALGVVAVLALAAAAGSAALYRDLRSIRTDLTAARGALRGAVDGPAALRTPQGRAATRAGLERAVQSVKTARRRATGSIFISATQLLPGLASQRSGLIDLIDDSGVAATAGRDLLLTVDTLAERNQLRDGLVPLESLRRLRGDAASTGATIGRLVRSSPGLWGPLGDARREFDDVVASTSGRLTEGADALGAALTFMGAEGDRRYLVAAQNNAEMRDQGMVLSYAVARFVGGRLTFEGNGRISDLALRQRAPTPIPPGTERVFGSIQPTLIWQSVNATADFAWTGRAMADMYRQATGEDIDGVIAIDVPGLAAMLRAVGPVQIEGVPEAITADNAARILLHDLYEGLAPGSDQGPRREKLGELTEAVSDRLTTGTRDAVALGRELGDAAAGGHLKLWSKVAEEESVFERTGLGGPPASDAAADRTFHLAVENRTATKLDYYVKPSVRQDVHLTPEGTAIIDTRIVVDNRAPGQPPSYQLGPDQNTKNPGDYIAWVLLWAPRGSRQPGAVTESGLELTQQIAEVAAGQKREVGFQTIIPRAVRDGRLELRLVPQSRLVPMDLDVRLQASGWDVGGQPSWQGPWDRVRTFTWEVRR